MLMSDELFFKYMWYFRKQNQLLIWCVCGEGQWLNDKQYNRFMASAKLLRQI